MKKALLCLTILSFLLIESSLNNIYSQWTQCEGAYGGYIYSITGNGNTLYAGTAENNGVFKSTDNGIIWKRTAKQSGNIRAIYISGNNIIIGTKDSGIYYSSNNGNSWNTSNIYNTTVTSFTKIGDTLYASSGYLYKSSNNGIYWINTGVSGGNSMCSYNNMIIIGSGYGVHIYYTNTGQIYQTSIMNTAVNSVIMHNNTIFAGTIYGIYKSTNNGINWNQTLNNIHVWSMSSNGTEIFAGTNNLGVIKSNDNGGTFNFTALDSQGVHSLYCNSNNIYAGTDSNGIFHSTNSGNEWTQKGLNILIVKSFAKKNNLMFAGIYTYGVFRSTNYGLTWSKTNMKKRDVNSITGSGNYILAGCSYAQATGGGLYISSDNGINWEQWSYQSYYINALTSNGNNVYAGGKYGPNNEGLVALSTNNGYTWNNITWPQSPPYNEILSLKVNENDIFAGTKYNGVYYSSNNGGNWSRNILFNQSVNCLALCGDTLYAGTDDNGIFFTTNNGLTWTQTTLNNKTILALATSNNLIIAGTYGNGIYISTNNGINWTQKNDGFDFITDIHALLIDSNYIFAGTSYQSVYRRLLTELLNIENISLEIPKYYSLEQNYPNPFNPETKIQFDVMKLENVKITVFDVTGKELGVLVNERMQPGTYEVEWNGGKYASGIYFYTMIAGKFKETKRMILLK